MKGAIYADLGQYSFELMKSSLEAAVNAETASVAAGNPSYAKALALTSDKIAPIFGTAGATLESVSEGIRAVEALQREDAEAYAKSAGRSLSGVIQATLFATNRGFPGAAAGAAEFGGIVTFTIFLYAEGIMAFGQLGVIRFPPLGPVTLNREIDHEGTGTGCSASLRQGRIAGGDPRRVGKHGSRS